MRSIATDPTLTYVLIAINVVLGIGSVFGGNVGTSGGDLTDAFALSRGDLADGELYRLITSGFVHVGLFHLATNMLALWILGTMLEPAIGRARFALIYFVSLFAGSLGVLLYSANASAGASGAVFGLMGAAIVISRSRGLSLMESGLGLWLGLNLLITFTIPNISIGGHIGGLVGGFIAALIVVDLPERARLPRHVPEALCAALGVVVVAASLAQYA